MGKKSKLSIDEKEKLIIKYLNREISFNFVNDHFNINPDLFRKWVRRYQAHGIDGLQNSNKWNNYSKELKIQAIFDFKNGFAVGSILDKYDISSGSVLKKWIKKYNSYEELKDSRGENSIMTIGRNATFEEKLDAVKYCLKNQKNYHKTSKMYKVSYQQIYSWVKKYEEFGEDSLDDRRGKPKPVLTEEDRLKIAFRKLEKENERLRAENLFLKKLEELERK